VPVEAPDIEASNTGCPALWSELNEQLLSVVGSFPASTGVLIVSTSSQQNVREEINTTGSIDSWTTSEIKFTVETLNTDTSSFSGEDFSFVLLGG